MNDSIETKHNKLIVFDINLYWRLDSLNERESKDISLVLPLIAKAALYQTVVISTSAALKDAIDFANKINLEKGYILASGGAVIYDLSQKQVIYKSVLTKDEIEVTFHHGLNLGVNMVITTINEKYIFLSNTVTYEIIDKKAYSPYHLIDSYSKLKEVLNNQEVVDISFLHLVSPHKSLNDNFNIYKWERYFDNEINDLRIKLNKTSIFAHIAKKDSTKLNTLLKIMILANVTQLTDVLYIAATSINQECFIKFKNALISDNETFKEEIAKISKKRMYVSEQINNIDDQFGLKSDTFWK